MIYTKYEKEGLFMKSRIISVCLCVVAIGISMLMTVKLINSDGYTPPAETPTENEEPNKLPIKDDNSTSHKEVELTANSISSFADKVESFVDTLAYGDKKNYGDIDYVIDNLNKISDYLITTEVGDKAGSEYLKTLANSFGVAKSGFTGDGDFSQKVSMMLGNIDTAASKLGNERIDYYPKLDTSANGALTLAMLALYENQIASADGSTFTVTVGGNVLLGDKLSTAEALKFANQAGNYKHSYPFFGISSVISRDDMTFISLEAPLTTENHSDSTNPSKGSPELAEMLKGIESVSIASHNVMQYGEAGYRETETALNDKGIITSGQQGVQSTVTPFGKIVCITFDLTETPVTDEQKDRNKEVISNAVSVERENGADLIVVLINWNTRQRKDESLSADYLGSTVSLYEAHFDAYNKEIARAAIGNGTSGADLVVGYGSRVAQGIESYNNKMIVYCPGDLTYSGSVDKEMKNTDYSFLFRQTFVKDSVGVKSLSYRIIPIVNTSEEDLYLPRMVFDETADKIIENLVFQSRYFGNAITNFNYIKIAK